jgi:hypothetical protein
LKYVVQFGGACRTEVFTRQLHAGDMAVIA